MRCNVQIQRIFRSQFSAVYVSIVEWRFGSGLFRRMLRVLYFRACNCVNIGLPRRGLLPRNSHHHGPRQRTIYRNVSHSTPTARTSVPRNSHRHEPVSHATPTTNPGDTFSTEMCPNEQSCKYRVQSIAHRFGHS
jgi:hypothetical protein